MFRPRHRVLSLVLLLAVVIGGGIRIVSAQDSGAPDYSGHPLLGTWHLIADVGDGDTSCPTEVVFTSDGAYIGVDCEGLVEIGAWEQTGDQSATLTLTSYSAEGAYRIRAAIDIAEDGQSFTAPFTFELIDPTTGEGMGEYGPALATATRPVVEAPGTPEGAIPELFSLFEEGPTEATPAS